VLVREHEVIGDPDAYHLARPHEAFGQGLVIGARRGVAGRMVVKEHDGRGRRARRFPEDFSRMDDGRIQRPLGEHRGADQPVAGIEHDDAELLDPRGAELRNQPRGQLEGRRQPEAFGRARDQGATAQFQGGQHLGGARRADARLPGEIRGRQPWQTRKPVAGGQQTPGQRQDVLPAFTARQHDGQHFVVPEHAGAMALQLLARTVMESQIPHVASGRTREARAWLSILTGMSSRSGWALVAFVGCLAAVACGEPPAKEIDMARRAIEAARKARAEVYAPAELAAAEQAFEKSGAAVTGRDFKLALNHALTSHERAQAAARLAAEAEAEAELRGRLGVTLQDATTRLAAARERVAAAGKVRATRRVSATAGRVLSTIEADLQKVRASVDAGDLKAAGEQLGGVNGRIAAAIEPLSPAKRPVPPARRRPRTTH